MSARKKTACLGPAGSYSVLAAEMLCPGSETVLCRNFGEVATALLTGKTDSAVIPIENSIQGGVLQNLDLLEREEVYAVAQTVLPIDHRLVTLPGVALSSIEKVYSHEQAIGQCSEFLAKHLPRAQCIFTDSTARSLSMVDGTSAGIVGSHVKANGMRFSESNIANEKNNFTQFFRLVRREEGLPDHSKTVFFCAVLEHRPGALLQLLRAFFEADINLTRIESRPIPDVFGEYRFFIAFDGDYASERVRHALDRAKECCRVMKILGAYS